MTTFDERNGAFCRAQVDAQLAYIDAECAVRDLEREVARLRDVNRELWQMCHDVAEHECDDYVLGRLEELGEEA